MEASTRSTNTGYVQMGTFSVSTGGAPKAVSVVPASGSGFAERFSFTISDPGGSGFLTGGSILFAATLNMINACYLVWSGSVNTISLAYNNPSNGQTSFTPATSGVVTNQQCS